jgi:hypothetical protein
LNKERKVSAAAASSSAAVATTGRGGTCGSASWLDIFALYLADDRTHRAAAASEGVAAVAAALGSLAVAEALMVAIAVAAHPPPWARALLWLPATPPPALPLAPLATPLSSLLAPPPPLPFPADATARLLAWWLAQSVLVDASPARDAVAWPVVPLVGSKPSTLVMDPLKRTGGGRWLALLSSETVKRGKDFPSA